MYGTVLADGTFLPGSCAVVGNDLEITTKTDSVVQHMADLMDPQKTKIITFHVGNPIAVYEGYTKFLYMQPDTIDGKVNFWLTKE